MFFTITGYVVWFLIALALFFILCRSLWDGYRAFTILRWAREITRRKKGNFSIKSQIKFFLNHWREVLFTYSGQFTISGPDGYWNDHNDWKVRALKEETISEDVL